MTLHIKKLKFIPQRDHRGVGHMQEGSEEAEEGQAWRLKQAAREAKDARHGCREAPPAQFCRAFGGGVPMSLRPCARAVLQYQCCALLQICDCVIRHAFVGRSGL